MQRDCNDFLVSLKGLPFDMPCCHHSAIPTLSVFPDKVAALFNQLSGTGPFRNSSLLGHGVNLPVEWVSCSRLTGIFESGIDGLYIYINTY